MCRVIDLRRLLLWLLLCLPLPALAERESLQLFVQEPYLELHSGPGRGYPVTQVIVKGGSLDVLFRRTDWFKVRSERGVEGWVPAAALSRTTLADGTNFDYQRGGRREYAAHNWELGFGTSDFGGATMLAVQGSRALTDQLAIEVAAGQFMGTASNGYLVQAGLTHVFEPAWRLSPLVSLGGGLLHIDPKATLVQQPDRDEQTAYVGAGARYHLARRFLLRGEFRHHRVFTSRDTNERIDEWKLGFAFFF